MKKNLNSEIDGIDIRTVSPQEFQRLCRSFIINVAHRAGIGLVECEDVYQEIMVKLFLKDGFRNFNPARRLTAYLATVVRRTAYDMFARTACFSFMEPEVMELVCDEAYSSSPAQERAERAEYARELLGRGIEILRTRMRETRQIDALVMRELEGKTTEETARLLGESVDYIHLACYRCKAKLRGIITELKREEETRKFCA